MKTTPIDTETAAPSRSQRSPSDLFAIVWANCLGAGHFPWASGTFASLLAIPVAYALSLLPSPSLWGLAIAAYTGVTVWAAHRAGKHYGEADARQIVADEWAGFFVAVAFLPLDWKVAVAGFFLFRFFDIFKPWPASFFDRMKNGFGVTFDDVAAGLWTRGVLEVLWRLGWLGS